MYSASKYPPIEGKYSIDGLTVKEMNIIRKAIRSYQYDGDDKDIIQHLVKMLGNID